MTRNVPLPKRQRYIIAEVTLNVEADDIAANAVTNAVQLPEPVTEPLSERELVEYIISFKVYAVRALDLLNDYEKGVDQPEDQLPPELRITISIVDSDNTTVGRVQGNGRAYGPRGEQLTRSRSPRI